MNILFFLSPKQDLMYVYDDFPLRQTLEKWENNRYASIPVLNRKGEYVGTLTEGDIPSLQIAESPLVENFQPSLNESIFERRPTALSDRLLSRRWKFAMTV